MKGGIKMIRIGIDTCGAFDLKFAFTYLNTDKKGQECCGVITDCDEYPSIINAHSGTCLGKCSDAVGLIAYYSYSGGVDINDIIDKFLDSPCVDGMFLGKSEELSNKFSDSSVVLIGSSKAIDIIALALSVRDFKYDIFRSMKDLNYYIEYGAHALEIRPIRYRFEISILTLERTADTFCASSNPFGFIHDSPCEIVKRFNIVPMDSTESLQSAIRRNVIGMYKDLRNQNSLKDIVPPGDKLSFDIFVNGNSCRWITVRDILPNTMPNVFNKIMDKIDNGDISLYERLELK